MELETMIDNQFKSFEDKIEIKIENIILWVERVAENGGWIKRNKKINPRKKEIKPGGRGCKIS
jgi:hypothetical protein